MKVTVQSSKLVKPVYGNGAATTNTEIIPLSVLDKATFHEYTSVVYLFHPPATPKQVILETGLAKALGVYREWAGRLGMGNRAILLNDAGARLITATADVALSSVTLLEQTPELQSLCPNNNGHDDAEELLLIQITRFPCGSFAVSSTTSHLVADGHSVFRFIIDWGKATRGAAIDPVPVNDRMSIVAPRNPPRVEFEHRGVEFVRHGELRTNQMVSKDKVVVHRVHFTLEMLSKLKSHVPVLVGSSQPYTTLQCVVAHLWRCITKARGLSSDQATRLIIPVNGRRRMIHQRVPEEYAGNFVLWAQPTITAGELLGRPLWHTVELVSREVARIDDRYFRSFIDFASSEAVEDEGLLPITALEEAWDASNFVYVSNLKGIPTYDLDFGDGRPFFCTRCYPPMGGYVFIMPTLSRDGSMDVQVCLRSGAMEIFKDCCYSLRQPNAKL
ncbi:hypothetical protein QOZ80_9BG0713810 [Eleusine coracana subsp. coracana]|nr:hypothetical protein QOZ80_9BG0713810 [Eleusine coracana subsp. coracana]